MTNFDSIIIEPDTSRRNRLKTVATGLHLMRKTENALSTQEALSRFGSRESFDIVFLSGYLGDGEIKGFIEEAKKSPGGQDAAYIVVLKIGEEERAIAEHLLGGAHSFLREPYSVDALREITEIAVKVKKENSLARRKAALKLLIATIMRELDKITTFMSRGLNVERAKERFRETCASLHKYTGADDSFSAYAHVAVEEFEKALPSAGQAQYAGASKRLRQKVEAKLKDEYKKEFGEDAGPIPPEGAPKK